MIVYVGTFTTWGDHGSEGLYAFAGDPATGALEPRAVAPLENPSMLAVSTRRGLLYAVTHTSHFDGLPGAGLVVYATGPDGELRRLGDWRIPGTHPAYVVLDRGERHVLVACGLGGAACAFALDGAGLPFAPPAVLRFAGRPSVALGECSRLPMRPVPGAPHPHCVAMSPDDRFALVSNLGHGSVHVLALEPDGGLEPREVVAAPGARHVAFAPAGDTVYVNDEGGSALRVFDWDAAGGLRHRATVPTVPQGCGDANTSADVHVHPSGRFVYVSNRGHDSIAAFAVGDGGLHPTGHFATGRGPRGFALSSDGRLLLAACQDSHEVVAFTLDPATGRLEATGATAVPSPVCVRFGASGS